MLQISQKNKRKQTTTAQENKEKAFERFKALSIYVEHHKDPKGYKDTYIISDLRTGEEEFLFSIKYEPNLQKGNQLIISNLNASGNYTKNFTIKEKDKIHTSLNAKDNYILSNNTKKVSQYTREIADFIGEFFIGRLVPEAHDSRALSK
ncbi:MAG: hypothetical protein MK033_11125 [Candidatus Caenarcaniphilales bacterium]|nr:hypothetical protein [Candidatus Caenarcaniphilales bacterium]